jgi:hypothetical protein
MVKLIFKLLVAIIAGLFMGFIFGTIFGAGMGLAVSFIFLEIVRTNFTYLASIVIASAAGGGLGLTAILILNKLFEKETQTIVGLFTGMLAGFLATLFFGVIVNPYPDIQAETLYLIPFTYGSFIGGRIGVISYPILCVGVVIWDAIDSYVQRKKDRETESEGRYGQAFYKSK